MLVQILYICVAICRFTARIRGSLKRPSVTSWSPHGADSQAPETCPCFAKTCCQGGPAKTSGKTACEVGQARRQASSQCPGRRAVRREERPSRETVLPRLPKPRRSQ